MNTNSRKAPKGRARTGKSRTGTSATKKPASRRATTLTQASGTGVIGIGVDDSGLVSGVAETVAELATMGRVNMTSCVVNAPAWRDASAVLRKLVQAEPGFQCGLHLNLTEGVPLSAELAKVWPTLPSLERVLVGAHLRRLPLEAIAAEWRAQCAAFEAAMGTAPSFIDGHQHVHALPGVREIVLADLRTWPRAPAVRNTGHLTGPRHAFKRLVIEGTGGRALQRLLMHAGLPHNAAMLGVYGFETLDYGALVRRWLAAAPREGALLMCHPLLTAQPADRRVDPIGAARRTEAVYLASAQFADDLAAAGFTVGVPWAQRTTSAG